MIRSIVCHLDDPQSVIRLGTEALKMVAEVTKTNDNDDDSCCIDILINNAGVSNRSMFVETSMEVDTQMMQINFFAGVQLCKILVPAMIRKYSTSSDHQKDRTNTTTTGTTTVGGSVFRCCRTRRQKDTTTNDDVGRIIWIGSVLGLVGVPDRTSYVASKFAVQGYCESLRCELMTSNVRVHNVNPGYICTNLSMGAYTGNGTRYNQMDEVIRYGANPKYVAKCILQNILIKKQEKYLDFTIVPTVPVRFAIYARLFCPSLLRILLVKRYKKIIKEREQKNKSKG